MGRFVIKRLVQGLVVILLLTTVSPLRSTDPSYRGRPPVHVDDVPSYQPDRPIKGTFIYLWQKTEAHDGVWRYWDDGTAPGRRPPLDWNSRYLPDLDPAVFDPATELYSGQDDGAQRWIVAQLTRARMDAAISSWWGPGHRTDVALERFFDLLERGDSPNPLLRVAIYYEMEGPSDPTPEQIEHDLRYIRERYAGRHSYLWTQGKPVIFVYGVDRDGLEMPRRWEVAQRLGFYTVLRVFGYGLYRWSVHQPDAWHDYRPAVRITRTDDAISVSPGFYAAWESRPRLRRSTAAFAAASRAATRIAHRYGHRFVLWTTGNEDGEGTGYFPQTRATEVSGGRRPPAQPRRSAADIAVLERILPPLPEIVAPPIQ
jgi:hypothetical protein